MLPFLHTGHVHWKHYSGGIIRFSDLFKIFLTTLLPSVKPPQDGTLMKGDLIKDPMYVLFFMEKQTKIT